MDPSVVSIGVPALFSVMTLAFGWFMFRQKVGTDVLTDLRAELRDCRAQLQFCRTDVERLTEEHAACQEQIRNMRAKYEDDLEMLRSENMSLMRRALHLEGPHV